MPAYSANAGSGAELAIRAVTYELKIHRVDIFNGENVSRWLYVSRYDASTMSGGTATSITPLRGAGPPATATAMTGASSFSGAARLIMKGGISGDGNSSIFAILNSTVQTPMDIIIPPGSVFRVEGMAGNMTCTAYFEEIRLPWSS